MGIIRLLLAFSVVVVHSAPVFGFAFTAMVYGKNAVQMFYTISGFYMALILNTKYNWSGSYRYFVASRFLRIFPAYATVVLASLTTGVVALTVFKAMTPLFAIWARYGAEITGGTLLYLVCMNLFLLGQDTSMFFWIVPGTGALSFVGENAKDPMAQMFMLVPQAWTVGTELWFYLLAPFLVRRVSLIALVMVAGMALRLWIFVGLGYANSTWNYRFFPAELPLFMAGSLGYHAYAALEARRISIRWPGKVAFYGMLFLIIAYYKIPWRWIPFPSAALQLEPIEVIFPIALPFIFAYTRRNHTDRFIGEFSYPVYLLHWLVIDILRMLGSPWVDANLGALTCLLTLLASIALWFCVDRPIDAWRQTLSEKRSNIQAS